jgi:DNA (cytosine-5)-methyltransferase 1
MSVREEFVLVREAAEMLGVCPNTIRAWGANGRITEYRHPVNSYRMFRRKDIEQLIQKLKVPISVVAGSTGAGWRPSRSWAVVTSDCRDEGRNGRFQAARRCDSRLRRIRA